MQYSDDIDNKSCQLCNNADVGGDVGFNVDIVTVFTVLINNGFQ